MNKQQLLNKLYEPYKKCTECPLGFLGRKNVVFGHGNPNSKLIIIGEAPGADEDEKGLPFVGASGKLLTKALTMVGINREDIFITNIVKCRPPNNRAPQPIEISTCTKILLFEQIKIIEPKVICTLGSIALNALSQEPLKITKARGSILKQKNFILIPTFHPAYILRNRSQSTIWLNDLKFAADTANELL